MTIRIEVKSPEEYAEQCPHKEACLNMGAAIREDCLCHCNIYHNYLWNHVREELNAGRGEKTCLENDQRNVSHRHNVDYSESGFHKEDLDSERKSVELKFLPYQDTGDE